MASAQVIDQLAVRWPSGITNVWTNLPADRVIQLKEDGVPPPLH
jgi:hypothetical protein